MTPPQLGGISPRYRAPELAPGTRSCASSCEQACRDTGHLGHARAVRVQAETRSAVTQRGAGSRTMLGLEGRSLSEDRLRHVQRQVRGREVAADNRPSDCLASVPGRVRARAGARSPVPEPGLRQSLAWRSGNPVRQHAAWRASDCGTGAGKQVLEGSRVHRGQYDPAEERQKGVPDLCSGQGLEAQLGPERALPEDVPAAKREARDCRLIEEVVGPCGYLLFIRGL